jgi:protein TonB
MAPLTKDSLEVAASVPEAGTTRPAPQAKPTAAAGQLRADARSLEIPVKVHGSRIIDASQGAAPRTEPFEEQTSTMIVFPQGSVLRMSTSVSVGQMLVVTNLKTRQDAICRVIKVRTFTNMQGYVEVEFTHKQEGYWGVQVSANSAVPASGAVPSAPPTPGTVPAVVAPAVSAPVQKPAVVPTVSPAVAAPPVAPAISPAPVAQASPAAPLPPPTFVPPPPPTVVAPVVQSTYVAPPPVTAPAKQETPFVWIGTQEEVQPAASATATIKPGAPSLSSRLTDSVRQAPVVEGPSLELPKIEFPKVEIPPISAVAEATAPATSNVLPFPAVQPQASVVPLTMSELRGDEPSSVSSASADSTRAATLEESLALEEKPAESSRAVFGSLSGGARFGANRSESPEAFGVRLDSALGSTAELEGPGGSKRWILTAICVGVLCAAAVGGVMYFRSQANGASSNANGSAVPRVTSQSQQVAAEQNALQNSSSRPAVSGPLATVVASGAPAVTVSAGASTAAGSTVKAGPVAKQPVSKTAAIMNEAIIEHPLTPQRSDVSAPDAAPALDPTSVGDGSNGNALPGVISSSTMAAPVAPEVRPDGPIVIGGHVAEPRLVYRALPVYPANAKQAGVEGDVVIKTTIDQKGSVVDMHVVSGPMILRPAALDALRRWKYEPSKLDGQAISVQMLVTIKFSR